ncbi:MAG: hypothetical protein D9V47_13830 [Clostridia bacterium]|nr:MAG: hypothetical protein D9V47_13830 [Clostridia bacterium]
MRQVVNGKVYDTVKADMIAEVEFGLPGDISYCYEALHVTAKGNYFIFGDGGPATGYGQYVNDTTRGGGQRITPVTRKEALAWCEENRIDAATIERVFGDLVEDA